MLRFTKNVLPLVMLCIVATHSYVAASPQEGKPVVVCTTSILYSIVYDLAGDLVEVYMIANPSICPAHYDVRPGDVDMISKAQLILYHGFEPWINSLIEASNTQGVLVKISGPWNTPDALKSRYIDVANCIEEYLNIDVSARLNACLRSIDAAASEIKARAEELKVGEVKVVCMQWLKDFVSWIGFNIVSTYGPPEKLSTSDVSNLVDTCRSEEVALVIDNLQSGTAIGEYLSDELGLIHVVLTNFPYTEPNLTNFTLVMKRNAKILFEAVTVYKYRRKLTVLEARLDFWRTIGIGLSIVSIVEAVLLIYLWRRSR